MFFILVYKYFCLTGSFTVRVNKICVLLKVSSLLLTTTCTDYVVLAIMCQYYSVTKLKEPVPSLLTT